MSKPAINRVERAIMAKREQLRKLKGIPASVLISELSRRSEAGMLTEQDVEAVGKVVEGEGFLTTMAEAEKRRLLNEKGNTQEEIACSRRCPILYWSFGLERLQCSLGLFGDDYFSPGPRCPWTLNRERLARIKAKEGK